MREPLRVLVISSYPPRQCGVGIYTHDLLSSFAADIDSGLRIDARVIALEDEPLGRAYSAEVVAVQRRNDLDGLGALARYINAYGAQLVNIQHEFGLWGGFDGRFLLNLLDQIRLPVAITFHTVPVAPSPFGVEHRISVLREIVGRSSQNITMLPAAAAMLVETCGASPAHTHVIPHGITLAPTFTPAQRAALRQERGLSQRLVVSTFGLLSRFKGLEDIIDALPEVCARTPELLLQIIGRMHPSEPPEYLAALQAHAERLGIGQHIRFISDFQSEEQLAQQLAASDIYVTAGRDAAQISSGTVIRAQQAGLPVISTAHPFAAWALADQRGILVPFRDSAAIAAALLRLIERPHERAAMGQRAREWSASMAWPVVTSAYLRCFEQALGIPPEAGATPN